jgi:dihydrolipoamide dehydrogenase
MAADYDVIVIGAGPAGYVAALRCAQLGLHTACIDDWLSRDGKPVPGGTCLNVGCIPSKALLESTELYERMRNTGTAQGVRCEGVALDVPAMMANKDRIVRDLTTGIGALFKSGGIDWLPGRGQLLQGNGVRIAQHDGTERRINATHVILAPGSAPVPLDAAPLNGTNVVDSAGALDWQSVPRRLGIIGAGVIGLELGTIWRRLGAEVVLLEAQERFLAMADPQIAGAALRLYRQQGLDIRLGARLLATRESAAGIEVHYRDAQGDHMFEVDRLIVAVGRLPGSDGLADAGADLQLDERGYVHVDDYCETSLPGVYAIGDVVRGPMLAHKGSAEGIMVAERIAGQKTALNYTTIASVIYTHPEIAWVGSTEAALQQAGTEYRSGVFPFAASGRARAMQVTEGMVKVLSDAQTDRVLGVHILGMHASELIGQAVLAMEFGASSEDIARTVFAHPTLSEALHEAALAVDGHAIHIARPRRP